MKVSILSGGIGHPHAGWVAIDELAELLAHYFDAELLSTHSLPRPWLAKVLRRGRIRYHPIESQGGDVLIVVGRGSPDLSLINAIPDCRKKFRRIYAWVTDSYFQSGFGSETSQYDAVTVTAHEDVAFVRDKFGIRVEQLYQGADCLTWVPRREAVREIDLISYGRTPPSYQKQFSSMFHVPESPYLYLHSPLGNITGPTVHLERGMLFKLLQRTSISLAFHLYVEPQGDRPRSMMVTSRWLESLLSGCIVAGKRPTSRMAEDMLFWPGATLELPDDPSQAGGQLIDLLAAGNALRTQRRSNMRHAVLHHDWRYRIQAMCSLFELPTPALLLQDLDKLQALAHSLE